MENVLLWALVVLVNMAVILYLCWRYDACIRAGFVLRGTFFGCWLVSLWPYARFILAYTEAQARVPYLDVHELALYWTMGEALGACALLFMLIARERLA